ncbi:MAG: hypothetical protein M1839_000818 [Geoglossum umbratile]|nr:MAG: hypothetical protein M1839_000818 [Geoglossum umbratile]
MTIPLTDLKGDPSSQYFASEYPISQTMNGIPIHAQSPITAAAKASGITPETAAPPAQPSQQVPSSNVATTTAAATTESPYPAARPGAAPTPTSTGSVYGQTSGPSPTRTRCNEPPPPPQPGAVPVPFPTATRAQNAYVPQPPQQQQAVSAPAPAPTPYTSTHATQHPYDPTRQHGLGGPPGYVQNPYAAEPSRSQRAATAEQGGGFLRGGYGGGGGQEATSGGEGVWDTAKSWARVAGEKVEKAESAAWKKINQ